MLIYFISIFLIHELFIADLCILPAQRLMIRLRVTICSDRIDEVAAVQVPQMFAGNDVVALPSTVEGAVSCRGQAHDADSLGLMGLETTVVKILHTTLLSVHNATGL